MSTEVNTDAVKAAYEDVRNDTSDTAWAVFKFEGNSIEHSASGTEYDEFKNQFSDDDRGFGYVRITTGDELSKRAKFALMTWIGANISPLQRAKMSTDKSVVKNILANYAVEIQTTESEELEETYVRSVLEKAGGANYGTGAREH